MIAVRVIVAMLVLVTVGAVIMRIDVMLVVVGGGILVPLSWRMFVLVVVLEVTMAVGMGVNSHGARLPPDSWGLPAHSSLPSAVGQLD